jgi:hypothetical protein
MLRLAGGRSSRCSTSCWRWRSGNCRRIWPRWTACWPIGCCWQPVVLPGDLALRKAIQRAYGLDHLPSQAEVVAIAESYRQRRRTILGPSASACSGRITRGLVG